MFNIKETVHDTYISALSTRHQTYEVSKETPKNWKTKSAAQRAVTELCIMRGMDPDDNKLFVIEEVIDESKGDDIL
jgi:hypothetical protein